MSIVFFKRQFAFPHSVHWIPFPFILMIFAYIGYWSHRASCNSKKEYLQKLLHPTPDYESVQDIESDSQTSASWISRKEAERQTKEVNTYQGARYPTSPQSQPQSQPCSHQEERKTEKKSWVCKSFCREREGDGESNSRQKIRSCRLCLCQEEGPGQT